MNDLKDCCCTKYIEEGKMLQLSNESESFSIYGNTNKGEKIILKYFGNLLPDEQTKDKRIFLNYGYGNLWADKNILELNLCKHSDKLCYCTKIELTNVENLYFCFMDDNNKWDINNDSSYMIIVDNPITIMAKKNIAVALTEDDYIDENNRLFKKITNKILSFFSKIGNIFEKRIKI